MSVIWRPTIISNKIRFRALISRLQFCEFFLSVNSICSFWLPNSIWGCLWCYDLWFLLDFKLDMGARNQKIDFDTTRLVCIFQIRIWKNKISKNGIYRHESLQKFDHQYWHRTSTLKSSYHITIMVGYFTEKYAKSHEMQLYKI